MKQSLLKFTPPRLQIALVLILLLPACTISQPGKQARSSANRDTCPALAQPPTCPTVEKKVCPRIKLPSCPVSPAARIADKLVIGEVENVHVNPPGRVFMARIDTGAAGTSIHASNIAAFERDGRDWVRFQIDHPSIETPLAIERPLARTVLVKQAGSELPERRLVVKMTLSLGAMTEQIDVSLSERAAMTYPVLIGRNFLRNLAVVDVSQRLIAK
ncbi:MAG: ATP-dependent zinc protease [Gammaproteobacteria bacterium]|nr:ATP-dependent zinc protease [Gammaproteobacteria bacterium]MBQ0840886.1 ATP-dependent zinc protease [Gammaproteobacteria bacterium]